MRDIDKDRALCAQLKSHGVHASGWGYVVLEEVKNGFIHYIEQAEQVQQENERLKEICKLLCSQIDIWNEVYDVLSMEDDYEFFSNHARKENNLAK